MVKIQHTQKSTMTQNRIKEFLYSSPIDFKKPSFSHRSVEALFEGPKNYATILSEVIAATKEKAEREGYKKALDDINRLAQKRVENYIFTVSLIVGIVHSAIKQGVIKNLTIIDSRAKFCFDSEWVDINFVIDADKETEIAFSNFLSHVQHVILEKRNIMIELFYLNERNRGIDYSALKNDYSFSVKPLEMKSHATR